ncbi:calcium-translocating P-type ATPase, PMCA-type [Clostridium bornimense]|uniref:Calcium-translocating P-type ATPase, PMCA-type n=1 Tax=Clostridium bornimense TaxID=1216932 RepID=W6RYT0_9CLOT|nr:cation-translocating P-type ATPase [Clostridium bornimense]CDM68774.1 calcium-translocating P-type ATPase, PMCA-type [Clostridium bornimense]
MEQLKIREKGLTTAEAEKKLKECGHNVLEVSKRKSAIGMFLAQFNDFIIWVLIGATILSGLMGEVADAVTIIIIVIMNAILGFVQEFKTEKSLEELKRLASPTAKVIRDGSIKVVNAEDLVPGDYIVFESGDKIPADGYLVKEASLSVDESLLTGESVGVQKNIADENKFFMGTTTINGKGEGIITNTGMSTEMGKIAHLLNNIKEEKSPLKEKLTSLGKVLVVICVAICVIVTVMGIIRGQDKYQMFLLGVSLAVAAIPEGLAAIVTVCLALGVSKMLKKNALIRKLPAVETLGCTSVICSDKTGTLTQNKMTVKAVYYDDKIKEIDDNKLDNNEMLKKIFTYCNDLNIDIAEESIKDALIGDATEKALVLAYYDDIKEFEKRVSSFNKIKENPFDSIRKLMSIRIDEGGNRITLVKGAPERVLDRCKQIYINGKIRPISQGDKKNIQNAIDKMSERALRCLAGAFKYNEGDLEEDLIFVGVIGMIDPPRKEVKEAVDKCIKAGITPIMITGDHRKTAYAIGKDLNICNNSSEVIDGVELNRLSEEELNKKLDNIRIFARVSPKDKLRIVKAFKKKNKIVAMTGDGVNDAPAIKEADIGVAMGVNGTDVTKEAAAMVLLDDNFNTIVSAVEEGRVIYGNIRKFIRYLLSCNLGEVLTMFLSSLFALPTPLLPIQILFVNLATDGLPAIALGLDPGEKNIMDEKPRDKKEGVFARGLKEKILVRGVLIGVCTVLSFIIGTYFNFDLKTCRTMALTTLVLSQLIHVFECKSEKLPLFKIDIFNNKYLVLAVLSSILMMLAVIYIPFLSTVFHTSQLTLMQWSIILFFSLIISFINSLFNMIEKEK